MSCSVQVFVKGEGHLDDRLIRRRPLMETCQVIPAGAVGGFEVGAIRNVRGLLSEGVEAEKSQIL